jgi:predicted esterase
MNEFSNDMPVGRTTPMIETNKKANDFLVHFAHGRESGPWGSKITRLAEVARSLGMQVESLDYAGMDVPEERADKLVRSCAGFTGNLILVGSSMGGWVATRASTQLKSMGVFLLAPAFLLPGYAPVLPGCPPENVEIVHGWDDDVILFEHSVRVGREIGCAVHLVKDDHRLQASAQFLDACFRNFLTRVRDRHAS